MTDQTNGSAEVMDLNEFLGHETRGGAGLAFLNKWKQRTPPTLNILLHTKASIVAVWQHRFPKIVTREIEGKEVVEVWSGRYNSLETADVMRNQYKHEDDGSRSYPPQICPLAIALSEIDRLVHEGKLHWSEKLFEFEGDDPEKKVVLHAGTMLNNGKRIWENETEEAKKEAMAKGFPPPLHGWRSNCMARCQYIFTVLDYDSVDGGIQILEETAAVGDKLKKAIRDRKTSEGEKEGNPLANPYVFQIKYDKNAMMSDRYDVVAVGRLDVSDEMLDLVVKKNPPDLTNHTSGGNIEDLRGNMEDHYCGPADLLDWDFIFAKAEEAAGVEPSDISVVSKSKPSDESPAPEKKVDRAIAKSTGSGDDVKTFNAAGVEISGCECGAAMLDGEDICHSCGADYSEENASGPPEPEPEPKPAPRRRSKKGTASERAAADGKDVGF